MTLVKLCLAIFPVLAVLAVTALFKGLLLPFSALRHLHRERVARA